MPESALRKATFEDYLTRVFTPTEPIEIAFPARRFVAEKVILEVWSDAEIISVRYADNGKDRTAIAERHHFVDPSDALFLVKTTEAMRRELAEARSRRSTNVDALRFAGQVTNVETGETEIVFDRARDREAWPL